MNSLHKKVEVSYSLGDLYNDISKNISKTILYDNVSSDSDGVRGR